MCFSPQQPAILPHPNFKKVVRECCVLCILTLKRASRYSGVQFFHIPTSKSGPNPSVFLTFWLWNVLLATAACNFSTSQLQKVVRTRQFFNILTCKCASRYSGVQFFHIPTSNNGPRMVCFVHFDLKMCFLLQQCAIFPHPNFKKWSEPVSFFNILTLKCASRYSGVQLLISPLNSYLRTHRFTEPTFRPSRPTNHWKNAVFRDFTNISHVCILFLLTFAQLYLLCSDSTSLLCFSSSDSTALLCFFNSPYCRKFHF